MVGREGLEAAVEQAADGVVITDAGGNIQYVNPAFTALTGYAREEVFGENPRILKSGRQQDSYYREMWQTIGGGGVWHGEVINRRKDGSLYTEEMRITPVRGAAGEIVSYIAIKRDVTARRAAEEAQRFLAAIVESSEDAIVACSAAGIILTWNGAAELLFGCTAAEAIGQPVSVFLPSERISRLARRLEADGVKPGAQGDAQGAPGGAQGDAQGAPGGAQGDGQGGPGDAGRQFEDICRRGDGRTVPVSVTGAPIRNAAGEVVAISVILRDITERQASEQARALLASLVESSGDAIIGTTLDGVIVSWNRGAEVLYGYSSEEALGKNAAFLAPPDRCDEVSNCLVYLRKGSRISPFETLRVRKDGSLVDVMLALSPILNPAGEVVGVSGIVRDIGNRLQAQRKLRESEELFREVFEHAPFGMYVSGLDGGFRKVNAEFCRMLGYTEAELLATAWAEVIHPDDAAAFRQRMERLWSDASCGLTAEKRYLHRGGRVVWVRMMISAVRDPGGSPAYFVVHVEDISERKRAAEALEESEHRFRNIADSCPAMLWVTDGEGKSQFANRMFLEFSGCSQNQVEGSKWRLLFHPEDAARHLASLERAVRERTPFRDEARVRRADGEWRLLGSYAEPRLSASGEYLGHVGLSSDITDRRQAEQALRSSEEKFRQLTENIHEVFWMMTGASDEVLYISPAYEQIWERTRESLYRNPMSWAEAIHPDDAAGAHAVFARQFQGEAIESEFRIRTPSGREKWVRGHAFPIRDPSGKLIRVGGVLEEVTERSATSAIWCRPARAPTPPIRLRAASWPI
jgi:PAS domain S-box-containing protein